MAYAVCASAYSQELAAEDIHAATDTAGVVSVDPADGVPAQMPIRLFRKMYLEKPTLRVSPQFFDYTQEFSPQTGNLAFSVESQSMPGLMGFESGAVSYTINAGNFTFTPSAFVDKYGYFGGLTTSYGFGGEMSFRISDRFSITAFGEYHSDSWAPNAAVTGFMRSSRFGGYGTWRINDRWGMNVGAQSVFNSMTRRWETVPILMPTFRINGSDAIGIDLGGILYEIYDMTRSRQPMNPTVGPPSRDIPTAPHLR